MWSTGSSHKKRKSLSPVDDDAPMSGGDASVSPSKQRDRKLAKRGVTTVPRNEDFVRLKTDLYQKGTQEIMASFAGIFAPGAPRLRDVARDPHSPPAMVMSHITDLRWQLANLRDLYKRPVGDVIVMGQEDTGQLGLVNKIGVDKNNGFPPTLLQDLRGDVVQVAAGGMHSVALTQSGTVYTWGCGDDGALGRVWPKDDDDEIGEEKYTTPPTPVMKLVPSQRHVVSQHVVKSPENEAKEVVAIDAGYSHTLFLTISGNVYVTGNYKDSDSGHFSDVRPSDDGIRDTECPESSVNGIKHEPVHVFQMPGRARMIAAGGGFNAAVLQDDSLVTWGMGHSGELARSADMTTEKDDQGLPELGQKFYCIYESNGAVKGFKENIIMEHFLKPKPVRWNIPGKKIVTHVACGANHLLVAARAPQEVVSHLYSAGLNNYGKLGHGDETARHELTLVAAIKDVSIARVAAGLDHSIVLNTMGSVIYAFGRGGYGQLGIAHDRLQIKEGGNLAEDKKERFTMVPLPVAFPDDSKRLDEIGRFIDVACGENHSMAITTGGKIYSWGYGEYGQAGNDPTLDTKDLIQPRLNEDWITDTDLVVYNMTGGAQHTLIVASRFKKKT